MGEHTKDSCSNTTNRWIGGAQALPLVREDIKHPLDQRVIKANAARPVLRTLWCVLHGWLAGWLGKAKTTINREQKSMTQKKKKKKKKKKTKKKKKKKKKKK